MALERGRLVGGGPPILLRSDHGLASRASVASGSGSLEGECFGEVGGAQVSAGGQSRLRTRKDEARAASWAWVPGSALPLTTRVAQGLIFLPREGTETGRGP